MASPIMKIMFQHDGTIHPEILLLEFHCSVLYSNTAHCSRIVFEKSKSKSKSKFRVTGCCVRVIVRHDLSPSLSHNKCHSRQSHKSSCNSSFGSILMLFFFPSLSQETAHQASPADFDLFLLCPSGSLPRFLDWHRGHWLWSWLYHRGRPDPLLHPRFHGLDGHRGH